MTVKALSICIFLSTVLFLFNPLNVWQTASNPTFLNNNRLASSGCIHNDKGDLTQEILNHVGDKDLTRLAFITSIYEYLLKMELGAKNVHRYLPSNRNKFLLCKSIVKRNEEGIMVLDQVRNKKGSNGFPTELNSPFLFEDALFELIYDDKGSQIYSWKTVPFAPSDIPIFNPN